MGSEQEFTDYYAVLQVHPKCDAKVLEGAYRNLAKKFHPDHTESADVERLQEVIEAYRVLRQAERRAAYDLRYAAQGHDPDFAMPFGGDFNPDEAYAVSDGEMHEALLLMLYRRRRQSARDAGMPTFLLEEALNCPEDQFEFHVWYLKSKGFIEITEQGTLAITIQGVDHVIATSRSNLAEKRRITQAGGRMD